MQTTMNYICNHPKKRITVATKNVVSTLTNLEIVQAFKRLSEKMKVHDPENPNLWVVKINGHKLWGILDEGAGPNREDVLTLLFPEDY